MELLTLLFILAAVAFLRYQIIALIFLLCGLFMWAVCALGLSVAFVVCFIDHKIKEWTK